MVSVAAAVVVVAAAVAGFCLTYPPELRYKSEEIILLYFNLYTLKKSW